MRSLIALQEKMAIAENPMFRKATQLRRQLRAEQRKDVLEAWSIPGGMVIDRAAMRQQAAYLAGWQEVQV